MTGLSRIYFIFHFPKNINMKNVHQWLENLDNYRYATSEITSHQSEYLKVFWLTAFCSNKMLLIMVLIGYWYLTTGACRENILHEWLHNTFKKTPVISVSTVQFIQFQIRKKLLRIWQFACMNSNISAQKSIVFCHTCIKAFRNFT